LDVSDCEVNMRAEQISEYLEALHYRCFRILRDRELASDALQEVLTRYYELLERQEIHEPLRYLYRMSTNYCIDVLRRSNRELPVSTTDIQETESVLDQRAEGKLIVNRLIKRFGPDEVNLMVYRYVDQMTYKEIAAIVGKSDRGVKKKIEALTIRVRKYLNR